MTATSRSDNVVAAAGCDMLVFPDTGARIDQEVPPNGASRDSLRENSHAMPDGSARNPGPHPSTDAPLVVPKSIARSWILCP